jgi:hypothetical protein
VNETTAPSVQRMFEEGHAGGSIPATAG